jgi:hypothetical protein
MDAHSAPNLPGFDIHLVLCKQCRSQLAETAAGRAICACDRRHGHARIGATLGRRFGERSAARAGLFRGLRVALEGAPEPLHPPTPVARDRTWQDADLPPDERMALDRELKRLSRCRAAVLAGRAHPLSDETLRRHVEKGWIPSAADAYQSIYSHAVALGRLLGTLAAAPEAGVASLRGGALEVLAALLEHHPNLDDLVLKTVRTSVRDHSRGGAFTSSGECRVVEQLGGPAARGPR